MNIYEILPNRSVHYGLVEIFSAFPQICAIEYGPEGTMHYLGAAQAEQSDNVFTSGLREKNVIFGSTDVLEKAVLDLDARKHPPYIFLIASSVSSIIGADLSAVARRLSPKVGAKLFAIDNLSLDLDYSDGYRLFCRLLVSKILPDLKKTCTKPDSYNILGLSSAEYHGKADRRELVRMLRSYLGLQCLNGTGGSILLEDLTAARFNLVVRSEALPLAQALEQQFGIPWIQACPYGLQQNQAFLQAAAQLCGRDPEASAAFREDLALARRAMRMLRSQISSTEDFSLMLHGDFDRILGLSRFFRQECGVSCLTAVCSHHVPDCPEDILPRQTEEALTDLISREKPYLLLSNEIFCRYFRSVSKGFPMFSPTAHLTDFNEFSPFLGLRGAVNLAQELVNTIGTPL